MVVGRLTCQLRCYNFRGWHWVGWSQQCGLQNTPRPNPRQDYKFPGTEICRRGLNWSGGVEPRILVQPQSGVIGYAGGSPDLGDPQTWRAKGVTLGVRRDGTTPPSPTRRGMVRQPSYRILWTQEEGIWQYHFGVWNHCPTWHIDITTSIPTMPDSDFTRLGPNHYGSKGRFRCPRVLGRRVIALIIQVFQSVSRPTQTTARKVKQTKSLVPQCP